MIQVTVPIFFYFDVISKIRPLEPKIHVFLIGDSRRRRRGDNRRRRGKIEMVQTAKNIKKVDWFQPFNYTVNTGVQFRKENL